ncbi:FKBP-type peptidyl-prolyl cis-trans isomerase [uncultured Maribacter sp.]|uniref:FKBP-type peptidyl-prolyl cis-trans isomerase n=1 Tax=uncultured Maribacter sp. TaxID=431308 RepID=UPI00262B9A70|nr:FKBP-type peptidyl-prolyl cis-trans isomerase [uncultured Maribacter sp.]
MKRILFSLAIVLFFSCGDDDSKIVDYTTQNEEEIVAYIAANNLNATRSSTGLYYVINEQGTGDIPTTSSNVTVAYKGYFTNGSVFDQSDSDGISFGLDRVIKGWTEGITYFNEGGSGILLVPSHLGYGNTDNRSIPGGSVLIFDVNLISIN